MRRLVAYLSGEQHEAGLKEHYGKQRQHYALGKYQTEISAQLELHKEHCKEAARGS